MSVLRGGGHLTCGFANNLQGTNDRVLMQSARKESGFINSYDEAFRRGRQQHVEEKRRVSLGQVSHRRFRLLSGLSGGG